MKLATGMPKPSKGGEIFLIDDRTECCGPIYEKDFWDLKRHLLFPVSMSKAHERFFQDTFDKLKEIWGKETESTSSISEIVTHPAYEEIINMGPTVVPLILRELARKPGHWFWALNAITNEDPILPEHRGNIAMMANDWLIWGSGRGYVLE